MGSVGTTAAVAGCSASEDVNISSDQGPEDTVEQYYTALADGEIETANDVVHESQSEVEDHFIGSESITLLEIEAEEWSVREWADEEFDLEDDELEETTADFQAGIDNELEEIGVEDHALVIFTLTFEEEGREKTYNGMFFIVDDGGEWLLYDRSVPSPATDSTEETGEDMEETGEDTSQEVTNRIQIQSVTGSVTEFDGENVIGMVYLNVTKAPEADDIPLRRVTYEFVAGSTVETGNIDTSQINSIDAETDDDVITSESDQYELIFDTTDVFGGPLQAGESARLTLTAASGASAVAELLVPHSLVDREDVIL